jgi:hypothetical protein
LFFTEISTVVPFASVNLAVFHPLKFILNGSLKYDFASVSYFDQSIFIVFVRASKIFPPFLTFLIRRGKKFNQIICWSIIAFQLFFPILASVEPTVYFILLVGILFHLSLAYISNLNDFFWTYVSAYPLIYFFATKFTEYAL